MRHRCSAENIARLVDLLSHKPGLGPQLARQIREGAFTVLYGEIRRSVDLGVLKQCWHTRDDATCGDDCPHLIVQNSIDGLRAWNTEQGRHHVGQIRDRMDALLAGAAASPLVLGWERGEWVLKDGNYTAAALYHTWIAHPPDPIRVYALRPIAWSPTLLPEAVATGAR